MTVGELREILKGYHDDFRIVLPARAFGFNELSSVRKTEMAVDWHKNQSPENEIWRQPPGYNTGEHGNPHEIPEKHLELEDAEIEDVLIFRPKVTEYEG